MARVALRRDGYRVFTPDGPATRIAARRASSVQRMARWSLDDREAVLKAERIG